MDPSACRFYREGMTFPEYVFNRYGYSINQYGEILTKTGMTARQVKDFFDIEVKTYDKLRNQFQQLTLKQLLEDN